MKKLLILLIIMFFVSCNKDSKTPSNSLKKWIHDKELLKTFYQVQSCDSIEIISRKFMTDTYNKNIGLKLATCYIESNPQKAKKELIKVISSGFNFHRIDSSEFASVYEDLKKSYLSLEQQFWTENDSSYFSEVERMVQQDKITNGNLIKNPNIQNRKKFDSLILSHAKFLVNYCVRTGHFPPNAEPSLFTNDRYNIDPLILAIHSPIKEKTKLLNFAINSAQKGKISWQMCIQFVLRSLQIN